MEEAGSKLLAVLFLVGVFQEYAFARREFKQYSVTQPYMIHERMKRDINTLGQNGHLKKVKVGYRAFDTEFLLELHQNRDLIPNNFVVKYQKNGKSAIDKSSGENSGHCHYHGKIVGNYDSWAALSTCHGLSGVVFDGSKMHFIEKSNHSNSNEHFIYRETDLIHRNLSCGAKEDSLSDEQFVPHHKRVPRDAEPNNEYFNFKGPWYLELVIVIDNRVYKKLNEDEDDVIDKSKEIANIVNALYKPLNITIVLVGVDIWAENDEIVFADNGDTTLANFLQYRREKLSLKVPNDNAQLITGTTFETLNGKAKIGPICTHESSGGISMDRDMDIPLVATTMAHLMSHNLGIKHDTGDCECPSGNCILSTATSTVLPKDWSSCSVDYLHAAFGRGMDYCLRNRPSIFVDPVVEDGDCDCGIQPDVTCCSAGECCDLATCKPKSQDIVCREAIGECDLPESCDGETNRCPNDVYRQDGTSCKDDEAHCYHGKCNSHDSQCKLLWGETGKKADSHCFDLNINGNSKGNCGFHLLNLTYEACDNEDVLCGKLHCTHQNESLKFGYQPAAIKSTSEISIADETFECRSVFVDFGLTNVDPGLTPDGSRCGDNKLCVGQKCISVESLIKQGCTDDCGGHGVRDNEGKCHCDEGFAPPSCTKIECMYAQKSN